MTHTILTLCIIVANTLWVYADTTAVMADPAVNIGAETYALAFRQTDDSMEVWLTVATETNDNARRTLAYARATKDGFPLPTIVENSMLNAGDAAYNGVPCFNPCNPNEMVFVSDRASSATSRRSNDLYSARQTPNGWIVERLSVNSSAWDDTPAFGPRGEFLYFSSDRLAPGSGRADIFVSRRTPHGWSDPVALEGLSQSNRHETSPFVHENTLYFSSDASGDQDIWSVSIDAQTGKILGQPSRLAVDGVNAVGANEYHPVISPGGTWLYFSSNRAEGNSNRYKIYRYRLPSAQPSIRLRVTARTSIRDAQKRSFFGALDSISNVQTQVYVTDILTGKQATLQADGNGLVELVPAQLFMHVNGVDAATRTLIVQAQPPSATFVSSIDTLVIGGRQSCNVHLEHVIYLDDTTTRKRTCEFTFRTFNVPFFITAYWCPTTRKYRDLTPCASLFTDDLACKELQQPNHCLTNEAYTYVFTPATLTRSSRGAENCVNYKEFNDSGMVWAEQVDRNIEHMRDEVRSALADPCLQAAVGKGLPVEVTYIGTTDDRAIHPKCMYTGAEYERIRAFAPHIRIDSAIIPFVATRKHFNRGGYGGKAGGNQLLSDLRSLYFAILFDNLCAQTIPQYRDLRSRGLLTVHSRGRAVDQRNLPYALKRAAGVDIRVPRYEDEFKGKQPSGGRRVTHCEEPGC